MNLRFFPALLGCIFLTGTLSSKAADISSPLPSYEPWSDEAVSAFENLLILEEGRVKPMHSFSRFSLMQLSKGKTKVKFISQDGEKHIVQSAAWLMDVLFRGAIAKDQPCFMVEDSAVVIQIGVSPKKKRDLYSYNELLPGRPKLAKLAAEYSEKQKKFNQDKNRNPEPTPDEIMLIRLGRNISSFEYLIGQFGFARKDNFLVNEGILPPELRDLASRLDIAELLDKMPEMTVEQLFQAVRQAGGESKDEKIIAGAMRLFFFYASSAQGLNILPPKDSGDEEWLSLGGAMLDGLAKKDLRPWVKENMKEVQALVEGAKESDAVFTAALQKFSTGQKEKAASRGEGEHSALEVHMYRSKIFKYALVFFIFAFAMMALSWLAPGSKYGSIMFLISCVAVLTGILLISYGVTLRCIIRSRPPITNLYDTILVITASGALLALIMEYFTRIRIGLLVAILTGILGMYLSIGYEAKESTDTIGRLQAVLDTNFWLALHVNVIAIGYCGGITASLFGMVYLVASFTAELRGTRRENRDIFKTISKMTYGAICFCLIFSLVGTVLGGIWANESWGRFWGWDPKENGALMICLWTLAILHARMGGYIRDIGVNMNAVILGAIVTFSWFGVNNLGVGLHSYGFTEGVWQALYISWAVMAIPFLMGVRLFFIERDKKKIQSSQRSDETAGAT